ncbi:hypothetical protein E8E13_011527 [Curvularia kusanoi]|uniref:Uncharacterized protein n=1 Tax=Curvularia kusanoi TaxID=90978 RepID=A0A9P4TMW0_CURKU|nr:hypothetical protein E8E13_011527 [Curvularia kusanoi]
MNNYSFLDSNSGVNMPRNAPSPSPSQTSGGVPPQMNGVSSMSAPQNGSVPMVNGLPSGGQQTDMNHLWSVVQQLSAMLEENKAATAGVLSGVAALQARGYDAQTQHMAESGRDGGEGGRGEGVNGAEASATVADLTSRLSAAESQISSLTTHTASLTSLVTDYENALTLLLDKLRPFAYSQTNSILALHKHYNTLLDAERATSMQLRLEHAEWQAGLGRVAEYARMALKSQSGGEEALVRESSSEFYGALE